MSTLKKTEELAISMWNKGGHGLELDEVVEMIECDRQHTAQVLCDLLSGMERTVHGQEASSNWKHEKEGYNIAIKEAQALIRQTLDPISNQE